MMGKPKGLFGPMYTRWGKVFPCAFSVLSMVFFLLAFGGF
jgi:hypothetical protein